jgi:predicted Zn finger-like uncharacterized protein
LAASRIVAPTADRLVKRMSASKSIPFSCPACGTKYKIVMAEPSPIEAKDAKAKCRRCAAAFPATEGDVVLKYFLVTELSVN